MNFKKYMFLLLSFAFFAGCSKKLDDVKFDDNPYDINYVGSKVIRIDSIKFDGLKNKVSVTPMISQFDGMKLYRDGILIFTTTSVMSAPYFFYDPSPTSGVTYFYQVSLYQGNGQTARSDAYSYYTP